MNSQIQDYIQEIISKIAKSFDQEANIEVNKEADQWRVTIDCKNPDYFIGHKASVLRALQHMIRVLVHKKFPEDKTHFLIDVSGFRAKREKKLKSEIPTLAKNLVITNGKTVVMVNLSGYERRIVHNLLNDVKGIETKSVGYGSSRKLLLMPSSEFGASNMDSSIVWDLDKEQG